MENPATAPPARFAHMMNLSIVLAVSFGSTPNKGHNDQLERYCIAY